jgi:hypothetical protein
MNPPPVTANLNIWAQNIVDYLQRSVSRLRYLFSGASAADDAVLLWDAVNGYPVISKGGAWRQIVLADGYAVLQATADITAAANNTAYKVALSSVTLDGITLTGTPATEITFSEPGVYLLAFSAQITSTSSSTVTFRFWPRVNGTDATGSTIVATLHQNGASTVVSRDAIFTVAANDVLNVMWAVSNTAGSLEAHAATAFAPASPSVTLQITRLRA